MFSINETLSDLKVKERNIFKILYSMNSHPVAMPGMPSEDARCYILFFSEGPNLSAFIGLYLPRPNKKYFYSYGSNPFPFEAEKDVEEDARAFAEEMGFLLDEINVSGMVVEDRNQWIEEQLIFGYKSPEAPEQAEAPAVSTVSTESVQAAAAPAAAVAPAPAPPAEPIAPQAYQPPYPPQQQPAPGSVPPAAPQPYQAAPPPQQVPPAAPIVVPPIEFQAYQPVYQPPQQEQASVSPAVPPQESAPSVPQPVYPGYPPQHPAPQQSHGVQPEPGHLSIAGVEPPVLEAPPLLEHPAEIEIEVPKKETARPAPAAKAPVSKKSPTRRSAPLPAEEELPVELEYEQVREPKPRSLFEEAIKQGVVKPPRPKAAAPHGATGAVTRDKEALARLLASF